MGPKAWSAVGGGLNDFSRLLLGEVDRRYKKEQDQKQLDQWNAEQERKKEATAEEQRRYDQEWNAKVADKAAAAAAAEKRAQQEAARNQEFYDLATRGVRKTREVPVKSPIEGYPSQNFDTETEEYYEPATSNDYMALMSKHGMLGSKDMSNVSSEFNNRFNQDLNTRKQEHTEQKDEQNYGLAVNKFNHGVEDDKEKNRIGWANANAHATSANAAAAKATVPKPPTEGDKKRKENEKPFVAALPKIGTPTGNQEAANLLFKSSNARTPQQQMNVLQSIVSDEFLEYQRQQGQGFINALRDKLIKGDKETINMYYNNIDTKKLKERIFDNISDETAQDILNNMGL